MRITDSLRVEHRRTILQLTEEHFVKEEEEVFPLAEALLATDELLRLGAG